MQFFNNLLTQSIKRTFHDRMLSSSRTHGEMKVTVVGAAGKVGQALSLMLKQSPLIDELAIHDVKPTQGLGLELNHMDTKCRVTSYTGRDHLSTALANSKIVAVVAAASGVEHLSDNEMWGSNSAIVKEIVGEIAKYSPKAFVAIATRPINSILPLTSEILRKGGMFNPNGVFGITTLDSVRANTFVAQAQGLEPECVVVPVVGGSSPETMVPVLSQAQPCSEFTNEETADITSHLHNVQSNVSNLKIGESGPLAAAFASARFVISLVKAIQGYPDVVETAFVSSKVHPMLKYLATPLLLGPNGVVKNLGLPKMNDYEQCLFDNSLQVLSADIKRGEKFAGVLDPPPSCDPCLGSATCPHEWCGAKI